MKRELVIWELRKLWKLPMIPIFLVLCILFNALILFGNRYDEDYVSYVANVTRETGGQMGEDFDSLLSEFPDTQYKKTLVSETAGASDIFSQFDAASISSLYIGTFNITGMQADLLKRKYEKFQSAVELLDKQDASLSLSAAGMTKPLMDTLFQTLCRAVITEGILLAALLALYANGYEGLNKTALSVYSTRTGRGIERAKFAASFLSALFAYLLLTVFSIGLFILLWNMGPIWGANMSSQFNYISTMGIGLPFITWKPFTIAGYLCATLGLGAVVVLVFHGFSFVTGMVTNDTYKGFVLLLVLAALNFAVLWLAGDSGNWMLYQLIQWSPVTFWWFQPLWFTDIGIAAVLPWQECWEAVFCTGLCIVLLLLAGRYFHRKDVA